MVRKKVYMVLIKMVCVVRSKKVYVVRRKRFYVVHRKMVHVVRSKKLCVVHRKMVAVVQRNLVSGSLENWFVLCHIELVYVVHLEQPTSLIGVWSFFPHRRRSMFYIHQRK